MTTLTKEMFEVELKALLKKYKAVMTPREEWCGASWASIAVGIDVDFAGIYTEEGDIVRPYETLELPKWVEGE